MFSRSEALLGEAAMSRLRAARVLVVGVGGVGSWCAEALVRTGVGHVTLVDDDVVAESNLNRQCPATAKTIGRPKVEAMAERLREINPACEVAPMCQRFASWASFSSESSRSSLDLVVDAIDSVDCKAELILGATETGVPIVSSMGAAFRLDPTKVKVTGFEKVEGDGLARALRQRFKRLGRFPAAKFSCVWSTEMALGAVPAKAVRRPLPPCGADANQAIEQSNNPNNRTIPKGSLMPVTATFGMCLASEAIGILIQTKGATR